MSQKKFRDELGLFVVEGDKLVEEALRSGFEVEAVYRRDEIGQAAMSRISALSSPSPSLALVRIPRDGGKAPEGLLLGLDSIRDPGNLGTILRVADWFGIRDVYASDDTVDVYNPKVVQATMGAVFRVGIHYCKLADTVREVVSLGGRAYGTFLDGSDIYSAVLDSGEKAPSMIVIGNEANGISAEVAAEVSDRLLIPRFGGSRCESLNAATAAAVTVAEFRRRDRRQMEI